MNRITIAMLISFVGTLCFLAIAFDILPRNYGTFIGIACYMAAGLVWALPRMRRE